MAITVKHKFVSAIPDGTDDTIVRPSNWNDDHDLVGTIPVANGGTGASTLTGYVKGNGTAAMTASATVPSTDITGLGTMSTQNANNVAITGGTMSGVAITGYIPTTEKGVANGVATLDAGGQVPVSQLPPMGDLNYQGTWNASTNTPTLTSSVGTKGYYYVVSVAGTTNLNGITDWQIGDWAVFNGSVWQKIDNTDAVTSVNGFTGTVVLTTTNIAEGTNEYFTTAKARTSVSAGTGISYNNTTGVITNSSPSLGGDVVGPASATDNAVARFDTTTGKLIQNSVTTIDDTGNASGILSQQFSNGSAVTVAAGKMWYDGSTGSWNAGMGGGNITQQIGEELFVYGKASAAITDSPLKIIYQTGATGASGVIQFAPTIAGITDGTLILGVATENIANNGFGRITSYGVVRGITTNGTAFSETWADGDEIYYNPVTGNPTNIKPVAPNVKVSVGTLIHAGAGGSGSIQVEINHGSVLGGTDANVQITSPSNGNILTYDGGNGYWKNTDLTAGTAISVTETANGVLTVNNTGVTSAVAGTGISVSGATGAVTVTNTAPDQTVAIASGTGISVTGTYPSFTVTNTLPSLGGTVTSVSGTAGRITSTGGTTPVIDLASGVATAGTTGSSTLIPVVTIDTYGRVTGITTAANPQGTVTSVGGTGTVNGITLTGTVTSSGNLTLGGTLSGVSLTTQVSGTLPIANGGSGATTAQTAMNAFAGAVTSGSYLRGNGTNVVMATIQAADVPTLNQNTTGTASNVTGTVAIGNGGTGQTTATAAFNALNPMTTTGDIMYEASPTTAARLGIGSTGQVLTVSGGLPAWAAAPSSNITTLGLYENSATIAANYTIGTGNNAMSAGPITINTSVTVTVPTGSTWTIV
jgi:hypothetical protein